MATVGLVLARKTADASRDLVWSHIVDAELRQAWWPGSQIDAKLGGSVSEQWSEGSGSGSGSDSDMGTDSDSGTGTGTGDPEVVRDASGVIDVCISGHVLGFRWRDAADKYETEVLLTLRSGDGANNSDDMSAADSADVTGATGVIGTREVTDITVSETGFGRFADAGERIADAQQGWIELLTALVTTVEAAAEPAAEPADLEAQSAEEALVIQAAGATEASTSDQASAPTDDSASGENLAPYEENRAEASPDAPSSPDAESDSAEVGEGDSDAEPDAKENPDAEVEPDAEPEAKLEFETEAESELEAEAELSFDDLIRGGASDR